MLFSQAVRGEPLDSASFDKLRAGLLNLNQGLTGQGMLGGQSEIVNTPNGVLTIPGATVLYRHKVLYATQRGASDQEEWGKEQKEAWV